MSCFARCIVARHRAIRRADEIYRRVWDTESTCYYYANVENGTTSWNKCRIYLRGSGKEPPLLLQEQQVVEEGKQNGYYSYDQENIPTKTIITLNSNDINAVSSKVKSSVTTKRSPRINRIR